MYRGKLQIVLALQLVNCRLYCGSWKQISNHPGELRKCYILYEMEAQRLCRELWKAVEFFHFPSCDLSVLFCLLFSCHSEALLLHKKKKKKILRKYVGSTWVLCVTAAFFGCIRVRLVQSHLPGSSPLPVWLACQSSLLYIYIFSE